MSRFSQMRWSRLVKISRILSLYSLPLLALPLSQSGCISSHSMDRWANTPWSSLNSPASISDASLNHSQVAASATPAARNSSGVRQASGYSNDLPPEAVQHAYATANSPAMPAAQPAMMQSAMTQSGAAGAVVPAGFGHRLYDPQCPPVHYCNPASIGNVGTIASRCGCQGDSVCNEHAGCGPVYQQMPHPWDQQEYIFDGGDHEPKVVVLKDGSVAGLQVEDTVIHYDTEDGRTLVDPSCRTKIYSPRFAAVRKTTNLIANQMAVGPINASQPAGPVSINDKLPSSMVMLGQHIKREDSVNLIEQVLDRNRGVPAEGIIPSVALNDTQRPMEDVDFIRSGIILESQWAKIVKGVQAALLWNHLDGVEILVGGDEALEIKDAKMPQELHLYELREARVRICKVASDTLANPGDEITFTIRFDNAGDQAIKNIVILDNLSPRLEFIENSQTSSIANKIDDTEFSTTANEVGSVVLKWKLNSELKAGEGGWIRFKCRVR